MQRMLIVVVTVLAGLAASGRHAAAAPLDPVVRLPAPAPASSTPTRPALRADVPPPALAPPAPYGYRHQGHAGGTGYYRHQRYRPPFRPYHPRRFWRYPYRGHMLRYSS